MASWLCEVEASPVRFLDVGCGDGGFLRLLHQYWDVLKTHLWGTELYPNLVRDLHEEGYHASKGRIEEMDDMPTGGFDLIVMTQVIEHVADPGAVIRKLAELLDFSGSLISETPNVDSFDQRLFKRHYWGGYHFPRHWNLFSLETLGRLLEKSSLKTRKIRFLPAHVFWIYSLHHILKYSAGMPRVAPFLDPIKNPYLLALPTALDLLRAGLGFRTSNMQIVAEKA